MALILKKGKVTYSDKKANKNRIADIVYSIIERSEDEKAGGINEEENSSVA